MPTTLDTTGERRGAKRLQASKRAGASILDHVWSDERGARHEVAEALSGLPVIDAPSIARTSSRRVRGGDRRHSLILSPGVVRLSTSTGTGWQTDRLDPVLHEQLTRDLQRTYDRLAMFQVRMVTEAAPAVTVRDGSGRRLGFAYDELDAGRVGWWEVYDELDRLHERAQALRAHLGVVTPAKGRGRCGEWSRKSRARMTRTLASLDWSSMRPGRDHQGVDTVPAMVTLTYPGDWLWLCPQGDVAKRHLQAFRKWWERNVDAEAAGAWKLEVQRRGAPHFHLILRVPTDRADLAWLRDAVRRAWARICWAGVNELDEYGPFTDEHRPKHYRVQRARHERAGVSIDVHEGARYSDPQRIAVYFSKHNSAAVDSPKSYQNDAPDLWVDPEDGGGVGRWWGYWRLEKVEVSATLSLDDAVDVARLLRGWVKAQGRVRRTRARRIDRTTGVVRARTVTRRYRVRALCGVRPSGFVLANDAARLATRIGRALTDPPDWPPGKPRPLP